MRIFHSVLGIPPVAGGGVGGSRQASERPHRADSTKRAKRAMSMCMRTLILGVAIGIVPAVTTVSPTQAGMIGKLQVTEPGSLAESVRGRPGGGVSPGNTVRSGSVVAQGGTRVWPNRGALVDSRSLNLKAKQLPRGRRCGHGGCPP